jgi:hypothetical protein
MGAMDQRWKTERKRRATSGGKKEARLNERRNELAQEREARRRDTGMHLLLCVSLYFFSTTFDFDPDDLLTLSCTMS